MNRPVIMARPLPGTVGETARVAHLFPAPDGGSVPARLVAFCGVGFGPGELELLDSTDGMPCVMCLLTSPSQGPELLGGSDSVQ